MKRLTFVWLAIICLAAGAVVVVVRSARTARSVRLLPPPAGRLKVTGRFRTEESAALFVGIRRFTSRELAEVPYAVDDAVDLAYAFAFDANVHLVEPARVALAISGKPRKRTSQDHLRELEEAHATIVEGAGQADIVGLLRRQAAAAGRDGILIVSFATHGFSSGGVPYVLSATSRFLHPETAISAAQVLEIAATSPAARSLIFVDACRERVEKGRGGIPEPMSVASLVTAMKPVEGQVVFYAAAAGKYAYDDEKRRNGVFTAAVLDGLQCRADEDDRGFVTVEALSIYVEARVRSWIQKHHNLQLRNAIQVNLDGGTRGMPVAFCSTPPPPPSPEKVTRKGSSLEVFDDDGAHLWRRDLDDRVIQAEVADLDGDGTNEVIAGTTRGIIVFSATGDRLWSADMNLRALAIGDLFRKGPLHIVALSSDDLSDASSSGASSLSVFDAKGSRIASYRHRGWMQDVLIGKRTSHHVPRLIVRGTEPDSASTLFMFNPRKICEGCQLWRGILDPPGHRITAIQLVETGNGRQEIRMATSSGHELFVDFEGKSMADARDPGAEVLRLIAVR